MGLRDREATRFFATSSIGELGEKLARLVRTKLFTPGLNCRNCSNVLRESNKKPACFKNMCDIQDIQYSDESRKLNALADAFINIECLSTSPGYAIVQQKTLEESGLSELNPRIILQLRNVFEDYKQFLRNKEKSKGGVRKR